MSRFLSRRFQEIEPYTPGEQPQDMQYIKLNTNENPYAPSSKVLRAINTEALENLRLYSDPEIKELTSTISEYYGVNPNQVFVGNGSDEILAFAFQAFHDEKQEVCFPEITYGFYQVFSELYQVPNRKIPLTKEFQINIEDYLGCKKNIILANPNAPTGICLPLSDIEEILKSNPEQLVMIDEAYIDFGGESCIPLLKKYDNLLVIQTFSKSRNLAGARIGFAVASKEVIEDLNKIKFSFNPYNVNRLSMVLGKAAMEDEDYFRQCTNEIIHTREKISMGLKTLGFEVLPSKANFIFARHPQIKGCDYFKKLREKGILVRHWADTPITDFVRITIGTYEQMTSFYQVTKQILER
ncbi:histidinol-phosphate transaminase [Sinanaerobacter sp. ZZT-01]|uniref:histidinol-phosphate transaminase n=1 Tax=Sinanaerobacter sp. ZZT-01 TaxID=3111540 RepID=UPI002D76F5AC|nr:histidinol-phosphate transaminase [Sinanaerobacter sp. ZZT-01]WRR92121.1 histidinol-phosphate transaminase [Sinanaerobacter sp. ZZT-01]